MGRERRLFFRFLNLWPGFTPLLYATSLENVEAIECLLASGANVKYGSPQTALHVAASKGSLRAVQALLEAPGVDVNAKDTLLHTPLHAACLGGSSDVVQLLLAHGADPNAVGKNGWTPLHRAASKGFTGICQLLVESGADANAALDSASSKMFAAATPRSLAEAARHIDTAAFLGRVAGGGRTRAGTAGAAMGSAAATGGLGDSLAMFQTIAALKDNPTVGTTPQVLRKRAAEGHARAKSIAVQKGEEEKSMALALAPGAADALGVMTPVAVRGAAAQLQKKPHQRDLLGAGSLSQTVPEIVVTPSSPRSPRQMSLSSGMRVPGDVAAIPAVVPAPAPIPVLPRAPSPQTMVPVPGSSTVSPRAREASPMALVIGDDKWQEEAEALREALNQVGATMRDMRTRIKFLEILSAVFGVLLLVTIVWR